MSCPSCGCAETHSFDPLDACFEVDPDSLLRCAGCGLIFPDYESATDDGDDDGDY